MKEDTNMPKTTKTLSLAEAIAAAEEEHLAKQNELLTERAAVWEQLIDLEQQIEDAEDTPEEIINRWKSGDDVPVEEYLVATASKVKLEAMMTGKRSRFATLERLQRTTEKTVAESVAKVVEKALPGVPVFATFGKVSVPEREAPVVLVQQSKSTERRPNGSIAGRLEVTYYRSPIHRELDPHSLEHAARALGFSVSAGQVRSGKGADAITLTVNQAYTDAPRIANVDTLAISRLAQGVLQTLAGTIRYEGHAVALESRHAASSSHLQVLQLSETEHEESLVDDKRTLTITVPALKVKQLVAPGGAPMPHRLKAALEDAYEGKFVSGVGVISSVELKPIAASGRGVVDFESASNFEVILTATSSL